MRQALPIQIQHFSQRYRPYIDGLRAIAVFAVIFCHAGFSGFSGGFIGVDVFFTISGFVVGTSILGDLSRGTFSLADFYARRAKRLAPALYVMLAAIFVFSILFSFPEDSFQLTKNILAVATMTSNIFLSKQTGYFDAAASDQPLLHTWSLSVEEQFYLCLPIFLALLYRKRRSWIVPSLWLVTVVSFVWAVLAFRHGAASTYYFAHLRAFEFLLGTWLATIQVNRQVSRSAVFDVLTLVGVAIVLAGIFGVSRTSQFPGMGALVPCGGTMLIIAAGRHSRVADGLIGNRAMVLTGKISYPLYLWHWPVFFALRRLDLATSRNYMLAIGGTYFLSWLTYRYLERRVRESKLSTRSAILYLLAAPLLIAGALAATGKLTNGFLFAYPAKIRSDVHWSGDALFDMPRGKACWSKVDVTEESGCHLGAAASTDKAILWGDSHAYHLIYFFDQLGKQYDLQIHDVALTLCPPIEREPALPGDPTLTEDHLKCVAHDKAVMSYVMSRPDIKTVFMAAAWQNYQNLSVNRDSGPNGHGFTPYQFDAELASTIGKLTEAGKHVILMDDVPTIPTNLINCDFKNDLFIPIHKQACEFNVSRATDEHAPVAAMLEKLRSQYPQVDIVHTHDVPCSDTKCTLDFDGLPIYRYDDYHHLSVAGSTLLYPQYLKRHPGELDKILRYK
ncbi:acyltransferase family protein [Paraburkholderia madseniana]|uniref:acyltransferase family protein n=1 Tax=Paraburkholderia madseniana TaxID=2599607 RepID=UPI001559B1F5|nr:acyltransferase family protein [Paraburkholderia madseniana]NPT68652.1 acyltransferase family protein [Paraburkholderia madseniana]